jgi:hypothetical protein
MVLRRQSMKKITIISIILVSLAVGAFGFLKVYSQDKPFFSMFSMAEEISHSKDSLLNYKARIDRVLDKIELEQSPIEKYFVTVTFSKYLSKDEIEKLVKDYNIEVLAIEGRSIENGTMLKGTFFVSPENGIFYDEKLLLDMLKRNDATFKGFTAVIANMQNQDIQKLRNDESVFLIDTSADTHFARNPEHKKENSWEGYAPSVFAELEKNNLLNP